LLCYQLIQIGQHGFNGLSYLSICPDAAILHRFTSNLTTIPSSSLTISYYNLDINATLPGPPSHPVSPVYSTISVYLKTNLNCDKKQWFHDEKNYQSLKNNILKPVLGVLGFRFYNRKILVRHSNRKPQKHLCQAALLTRKKNSNFFFENLKI